MTKRKRMCRKCGRRMVVEHENYEACDNSECSYYYSYEVAEEIDEEAYVVYMEALAEAKKYKPTPAEVMAKAREHNIGMAEAKRIITANKLIEHAKENAK